jgi:hypothetical protein
VRDPDSGDQRVKVAPSTTARACLDRVLSQQPRATSRAREDVGEFAGIGKPQSFHSILRLGMGTGKPRMSSIASGRRRDFSAALPVGKPNEELRGPARPEALASRRSADGQSGEVEALANSIIGHLSNTPQHEIEKLIDQLQGLRDFLDDEGQRVQHEIYGYLRFNEAANASAKIIGECLAQWNRSDRG